MKRFISIIISLVMLLTMLPQTASAYEFPHAFWALSDGFAAVSANKDLHGIIEYGTKIIDFMLNEPVNDITTGIIATKCYEVGESYEALGDYASASVFFEKYIPYAETKGWTDGVKIAKAKIFQYRPQLRLFTDGDPNTYYGAKHEPENGIYYGVVANGGTREHLYNESMFILYHELGTYITALERKYFEEAAAEGLAIEFALNCPNESYDINNINYYEYNLSEISNLFSDFPTIPIFLRFAAEFNVWGNMPDATAYINAFRYVSSYFKARNENVAIVFSPNQVSGAYTNINDFYPGDEYVDWVGMSAYSQRYFQANPNINDNFTEIVFRTGINADPVLAVQEIINLYGDRKPIMIAESGFTRFVRTNGEDTTDWAVQKMKEFYSYIPMIYPQVKLIAHFDKEMPDELNIFDLTGCPTLQAEYIKQTKGGRFIQGNAHNKSSFAYKEIDGSYWCGDYVNMYTYAHVYGGATTKVDYYVDGKLKGSSVEMPFFATLDLSDLPNGDYTLTVVATNEAGAEYREDFVLNKAAAPANKITVKINGEEVQFDQEPIIYRDRTMVPMRAIFEKLGATVEWNAESRTAVGTRGEVAVSATIGNSNIFRNGEVIAFDTPSFIAGGRTLVPVRAIAESFDCYVTWDGETKTVNITQ